MTNQTDFESELESDAKPRHVNNRPTGFFADDASNRSVILALSGKLARFLQRVGAPPREAGAGGRHVTGLEFDLGPGQ